MNLPLHLLCVSISLFTANSVLRNRRPHMMRPIGSHSTYNALRGQTIELECIVQGLWVSVCACVLQPSSIRKLDLLLSINLTCLSSIPLPSSYFPTLSSFHYLSFVDNSDACCVLISMHFFSFHPARLVLSLPAVFILCLTLKPHSVAPLFVNTLFIPSTHLPPLFPLLQSNSQSVMAEEGWRNVWVSDH